MKPKTKKILRILGICVISLIALGGTVYWKSKDIGRAYIRHTISISTTDLAACDRVDVFHVNSKDVEKSTGFPVRPYESEVQILGKKYFLKGDAEIIAALWRKQRFDYNYQALCHEPGYALRFYSGRSLLFETSVCFHCSNFYITNMFGSMWWGFDTSTPESAELLRKFQEIFPDSVPKITPKT